MGDRVRALGSILLLLCASVSATTPERRDLLHPEMASRGADVDVANAAVPPARSGACLAYDATHRVLVLFGGYNGSYLNDTWTWNGSVWTEQHPATSPAARTVGAMAFDPSSGNVILFGGARQGSDDFGDTWAWDGTNWTQLQPLVSPTSRDTFSMATDPVRGEIVLFGGEGNRLIWNDTWTWKNGIWTPKAPSHMPDLRFGAAMAYDSNTRALILFGGIGTDFFGDTWKWDGTDWTKLEPATSPERRYQPSLGADPVRGGLVLFGGLNNQGSGLHDDTWTWDGSTWTQQFPQHNPPGLYFAPMVDLPPSGLTVMFSGANGNAQAQGDLWTWNGSDWTLRTTQPPLTGVTTGRWRQLSPATSAPKRVNAAFAYDSERNRTIIFGGVDNTFRNDTWFWDGTIWSDAMPTTSATARSIASMAYDPDHQQAVLFGGLAPTVIVAADTWLFDGTTWTQSPAVGPPPRYGANMAFNSATHQLILWGGCNLTDCSNETWVWNGTLWTLLPTVHSPPPRTGGAMSYDRTHSVIVLYGGINNSVGYYDDTWIFDGSDWIQQNPATVPAGRNDAVLAQDSTTDGLVMFGGQGNTLLNETWTWDGTNWTQQQPLIAPPPRRIHVLVNQESQNKVILFGGSDTHAQPLGDTWVWEPAPPIPLAGVVSRKSHGSAGTYDVDLANGEIECRSGGVNGDYTIVFTFANPLMNVGSASISTGSGAIANSAIGSDAHQYIVDLSGVANAQTITLSLTNVSDSSGNFSAAVTQSMRVLIGDTNADGFVNSADIAQTKSQSGQSVTNSNFREDLNTDGNINSADIALVKSKSGTALP